MTAHVEHGLLVFLDVSPSEQLDLKSNSKICFTAIVCDNDNGITNLHQFKVGSWRQKLKRAELITTSIINNDVSIHAFGLTARQQTIIHWATDTLNQATNKIGAEWTDEARSLLWNGNEYPRSQVLGIGAYSSVLSIIGSSKTCVGFRITCPKPFFVTIIYPV